MERRRCRTTVWAALTICFFLLGLAEADLKESKDEFEKAEKLFYSGNQSDCIPLFEAFAQRLTAEMTTRTMDSEERSLLERGFDYLAQTYFNQNDLPNAKKSLVKLFAINPEYRLNEDLVSVKVIDLFNTTKKESLSPLSVKTVPPGAEIFLDGRQIGMSDLRSYIVMGDHSVEVKKAGFLPDKRQVNIVPPQPAVIDITLKSDPVELLRSALNFEQKKDLQNARDRYEQALTILKTHEPTHQVADVYFGLGRILRSQDDFTNAVNYYEQAIAIYEKEGDKKTTASALTGLAETLKESGRTDQAIEKYQKAASLFADLEDKSQEARMLQSLGELFGSKKDWTQSNRSYQAALNRYKDLNDPAGSAEVIFQLGNIALQEKRLHDAKTQLEEAHSLFQQTGDQKNLQLVERKITQVREEWKTNAVQLLLEGYQFMNDKQFEQAEQKYKEALEAGREAADKSSQVGALLTLGFLNYQRHDTTTAKNIWEEALTLSREIGEKENEALALYDLSTIYYTLRDYPRAEDFYKQSEQLYKSIGKEPRKRSWETQK